MISNQTIITLQEAAAAAEQNGQLTNEQLDIIYRENWFTLFVPKAYGGLGLSLPEGLQIEEALAGIDGSLGWTVTLCSGATLFIGYLQPAIAQAFFNNKKVCFGGSGNVTGIATITKDGYIINGHWKYATGAPHCTAFTANCRIEKDGGLMQNADGSPLTRSFLFTKEEVTIHQTWNAMGLRATAGHSFEVNNLWVANNRCFVISGNCATQPQPVYQYPFLPFAKATIAVNTLGMAQHFLEECRGIFDNRKSNHPLPGQLWHNANTELQAIRSQFYEAVDVSWNELLANNEVSNQTAQLVSDTSYLLASKARALVTDLYPYCGMKAAEVSSTINRIWRDLFTASQHSLLLYPPA